MNILLDCERMKHANIGQFYYCLNLGNSLRKLLSKSDDDITYYYPSNLKEKLFGEDASYLFQTSFHKLIFPKTDSFDILHCTHQGSSYFPKRNRLKKVLTIHDFNFLHGTNASAAKKQYRIDKVQRLIDRADYIIAISEFVKKEVIEYAHVYDKPVVVIYNGCQVFHKTEVAVPSFIPEKPFLYALGVFKHKKNFHLIPRLLVGNDYQLLISGSHSDMAYKNRILEEAAKFGVSNRVFLTGIVSEDEKLWYYSHCEAFIFPSIAEGFGLPIVEAMSFGKPVFLSRHTSVPEVGGDVAYYFNSFEVEDMQSVFNKGMEDFVKNKEQKAMLYKQQAAKFSWDTCAQQCLDVYHSLVDKG